MEYHVLASGSKGNSTFIVEKTTGILIDCGISKKQLVYRLKEIGYTIDDIDYVLLTHDHADHNKNIHIFDKEIVYTAKGNIDDLDEDHELVPYTSYTFGDIDVYVLRLSHDATNPIGFIFEGDETLLYMTDTGYVSQKNKELIHNLNYYIIESNHDIEMLMATRRPFSLKNRIMGDTGHLNNEYSAHLMCDVIGENTKEIVLAHLSQDANTKEKALETYYSIFDEENIKFDKEMIKAASQTSVFLEENMNIKIITVGKLKEKYLRDGVQEYVKRLGAYAHVNLIEVPDEKIPNNPSLAEETLVKSKEGRKILDHVKQNDFMILLDVASREMDSVAFSQYIEKKMIDGYSTIVFVIGGSLGHGEDILTRADFKLSFSPMTFPHQLMRLILVEQIYRAFKIMKNETYHK